MPAQIHPATSARFVQPEEHCEELLLTALITDSATNCLPLSLPSCGDGPKGDGLDLWGVEPLDTGADIGISQTKVRSRQTRNKEIDRGDVGSK